MKTELGGLAKLLLWILVFCLIICLFIDKRKKISTRRLERDGVAIEAQNDPRF
ncbi:MAG: hypothetical protein HZA94_03015 [Candidatus Vogelbacteria bacterium]|nr:hypothetical protein [Candidatus Vogelbacteria bacterium]